ncbi:phosphomannomutase [Candidatus Endobugula sertula]|uniref:phosphomannomutase n=1 Tax=Candidatus Endobugula sertula TaxID=62101 RepID=A0A1D2QNW3_9GAMM|nr:phosphomannomutase [Candidatus Endobugula sertula]
MTNKITCFKAYDVRGQVPDQLNEDIAYRIGRAFVVFLNAKRVIVGHDIRLTSPGLTNALVDGLTDGGADVLHIGQCGTEEVYFAAFNNGVDGGICVTASHNPMNYNGMKFVREQAKPISGDTGLLDIKTLAEENRFSDVDVKGMVSSLENRPDYIQHLLSYLDKSVLKPLKIASNPGNGGAGMVMEYLEKCLPFDFIHVNYEPDDHFPNGIPNPLEVDNRDATIEAVKVHNADLGIAWDGDFDRCFFFDETGRFIEGYYVVGMLAEVFLNKNPGAKVVHDPRLIWNTQDLVSLSGGVTVQSKTGHAFIKERMRSEDAVYGGEMSAHHYFRDFEYCDSGMIPWLLVVELLCRSGKSLSQLVDARMKAFPCSGEINTRVSDSVFLLERIKEVYQHEALIIDHTDGLSMEFSAWRFNVRMSNTEPVVRLNIESRRDQQLVRTKTTELLAIIQEG